MHQPRRTPTGPRCWRCTTSSSPSRRSPIVALNRAVAVAEVAGPGAGLSAVDALADELGRYLHFHATRADMLRRLGRRDEAADAYAGALALATNDAERRFLESRRAEVAGPD